MTTGYSGTPLARKLGVCAGSRLLLLRAPPDVADPLAAELPASVVVRRRGAPTSDVVVCFVTERRELVRRFDDLARAVFPDGGLWVAWPKRSSGVPTDLTEDVVRDVAVERGLVDNKVCAISDVWSGLRVVHRKENRR